MTSDFPTVIDACVLVQAAVRDTLLRLAEQRLFLCRWSDEIIKETERILEGKLNLTSEQVHHFVSELTTYFPDAWVEEGYKALIHSMKNDAKDRHVLAAAVKSGSEVIVTYNLKHFPEAILAPLNVCAKHPDQFLIDLYTVNPELVVHTLHEQGESMRTPRSLQQVLVSLEACLCSNFAELIRQKLRL